MTLEQELEVNARLFLASLLDQLTVPTYGETYTSIRGISCTWQYPLTHNNALHLAQLALRDLPPGTILSHSKLPSLENCEAQVFSRMRGIVVRTGAFKINTDRMLRFDIAFAKPDA